MKQSNESQLVTRKATSKITSMYASNINLFLPTQNQSTQLHQSTAFYWEILSIKAKLFGFPMFFETIVFYF